MMKPKLPMYIDVQIHDFFDGDATNFWLPLPVTKKEFEAALHEHGIKDTDYMCKRYRVNVPGLCPSLLALYPLPRVNFLAARLAALNDENISKFMAIMDTRHAFTDVEEYINFTYSTKQYTLLPDVQNTADLGQHYLDSPEFFELLTYTGDNFDAHNLGENLTRALGGEFTAHGYITSCNNWNIMPQKRNIPLSLDFSGLLPYDDYDLEWGANLRIARPHDITAWLMEKLL